MGVAGPGSTAPEPTDPMTLLALNFPVALIPLGVGDAVTLLLAFCSRRAPEPDLIEIAEAVGLAAAVGEQGISLAGRRHGGHRSEPGGDVALKLRLERMIEPHISAVGVRRIR